jgi:hypothetical protein
LKLVSILKGISYQASRRMGSTDREGREFHSRRKRQPRKKSASVAEVRFQSQIR